MRAPVPESLLRQRLLAALALLVIVDCSWAVLGGFEVVAEAYLGIVAISAGLFLGSWFYGRVRPDERLVAMLFGAGFLCAFSAAFSALNYFLITIAGERIDGFLAHLDQAAGFDWPALMEFSIRTPSVNLILALAYASVLPQMAVLTVCLGVFGRSREIYGLCIAVALAAAFTVLLWTAFPSFGPFTVYQLDPALTDGVLLFVDAEYVRNLVPLLTDGPGRIAPDQVKGLIAFPSFHAVLAVLVAWYARELPFLNIVALVLNALVLISTPVQGGHYVIDIAAGTVVALAAAMLAARLMGETDPAGAVETADASVALPSKTGKASTS